MKTVFHLSNLHWLNRKNIAQEWNKALCKFYNKFRCMICFQDIENNQIVIEFPCGDNFHKDCAIQRLLGSKFCPNCS